MATQNIANPYAPPAAVVADIVPGHGADHQPVNMFGVKGRMGRLRYFTYLLGALCIMMMVAGIVGAVVGIALAANGTPIEEIAGIVVVIGWTIRAPVLVFFVLLGIQRSHDMNRTGWATLWTLIPLAVFYWLLAPGTPGHNRFGPPPPPNSTGIKVACGIFSGLAVFFILLVVWAALMMRDFGG